MLSRRLGGFLAAALFAVGVTAEAQACKADLEVDNFSKFYDAVNSMNDATSGTRESRVRWQLLNLGVLTGLVNR
jgi:hypothetical protein